MAILGWQLWRRTFVPLHAVAVVFLSPLFLAPLFGLDRELCGACYLNIPLVSWFVVGTDAPWAADWPWIGLALMTACWTGTAGLVGWLAARADPDEHRDRSGPSGLVRIARAGGVALAAVALAMSGKNAVLVLDDGIAFGAGVVLTIFEWFLIATFWLVFPILMVEGAPVVAALRRSTRLANDNRGAFFGCACVVAIGQFPLLIGGAVMLELIGMYAQIVVFLGVAVVALSATTLQAALMAAGYRHVRAIERHRIARRTARVFH